MIRFTLVSKIEIFSLGDSLKLMTLIRHFIEFRTLKLDDETVLLLFNFTKLFLILLRVTFLRNYDNLMYRQLFIVIFFNYVFHCILIFAFITHFAINLVYIVFQIYL